MKEHLQITAVFAVLLMIIPCMVFLSAQQREKKAEESPSSQQEENSQEDEQQTVRYYLTKQDKTLELSMEEYVTGAVLAQMPADFEPSALQAQAVLARTYALYRRKAEKLKPTPELKGADMSDDTSLYQGYFSPEKAKELYKDDYETAQKRVAQAVKESGAKHLEYNSEPIMIAFHAVSDGHTRSAKQVWGEEIPYLVSVESEQDTKLEVCTNEFKITAQQFKEKLSKKHSELSFEGAPQQWLVVSQKDDLGSVTSVSVCSKQLSGEEFCGLLGLSSQSFSFTADDSGFTFTCKGIGHLVGMSQHGANEMAKQGSTCEEILSHYFKGTTVCE